VRQRVNRAVIVRNDDQPPRWKWLIIEWRKGKEAPTDYWLSSVPPKTPRERSPGSPGRAGRSSSTTASSRASSGSTTPKATSNQQVDLDRLALTPAP
jgi:hypothetical protein